jgi:hypothetical protein
MPRRIISDHDSKFMSSFWRTLWGLTGTKLSFASPSQPAANGMAERYVGTIKQMLRTYAVREEPRYWDCFVPAVEFAINDTPHAATGYTPFQLTTGMDPCLPIEFALEGVIHQEPIFHETDGFLDPTAYTRKFARAVASAKEHLRKYYSKMHQHLRQGTSEPPLYQVGQWVWVSNIKKGTRPKTLQRRWVGPYELTRQVSPTTWVVNFSAGISGKKRYNPINVVDIKPFVDPSTGGTCPSAQFLLEPSAAVWGPEEAALAGQRDLALAPGSATSAATPVVTGVVLPPEMLGPPEGAGDEDAESGEQSEQVEDL